MSVDALLSRLERVRPAGRGRWRACCPAHRGSNPSALSIMEADDGRVLLRCHAQDCGALAIVQAVGLEMGELFPPRPVALSSGRVSEQASRAAPLKKPWRVGDVARALQHELGVAYALLGAIAHQRPLTDADRVRAGQAQERIERFMKELTHAG
jgi:hypothetical protein